jgi:hypothetical protein
MRRVNWLLVVAGLMLALGGCKSAPNVVGKWKGELKVESSSKEEPFAQMGEAFAKMLLGNPTLELEPGNRFKLTMMGIPIEGTYVQRGHDLELTAETAMGMTVEEVKKTDPKFAQEKLIGTISEDGVTITLVDKDAKPEEGKFVFTRATDEPEKQTASSVSGREKDLVGSYRAELSQEMPANLSPEKQQEWQFGEAMLKTAELTLRADNSFKLNLMLEMEGKWKLEGNLVKLQMTSAMGFEDTGGTMKAEKNDMNLRLDASGRLVQNDGKKDEPQLAFVKK